MIETGWSKALNWNMNGIKKHNIIVGIIICVLQTLWSYDLILSIIFLRQITIIIIIIMTRFVLYPCLLPNWSVLYDNKRVDLCSHCIVCGRVLQMFNVGDEVNQMGRRAYERFEKLAMMTMGNKSSPFPPCAMQSDKALLIVFVDWVSESRSDDWMDFTQYNTENYSEAQVVSHAIFCLHKRSSTDYTDYVERMVVACLYAKGRPSGVFYWQTLVIHC